MWTSKILGLLLLVTVLTASPLPKDPEPLTSPVETEEGTTISTELKPPAIPDDKDEKPNAIIYLINLYAVKNKTGESAEEIVNDDIIEHVPEMLEPVASILLVVEAEDDEKPASLDEVANEFKEEGFKIEKIAKDGETKVLKINLEHPVEDVEEFMNKPKDLQKVRRKRSFCLSCKLNALKGGYGGGYGGGYPGGGYQGGCGGGGCGGGQPIDVVVVPVSTGGGHYHKGGGGGYHQPYYQPTYQQPNYQPPVYHPQPQPGGYGCNTCGGGGGGYGHSQSSAQASAQSSSW